jgi:hypothetical protein
MKQIEAVAHLLMDETHIRWTQAELADAISGGMSSALTVNPEARPNAIRGAAIHFACATALSKGRGSPELSTHHARLAYWALGEQFPGDTKARSAWRRLLEFFQRA